MTIGVLTTTYPADEHDPAGHFVRGLAGWLANTVGPVEVLALPPGDPVARLASGGLPSRLRGARGLALALSISARLAACARRRQHRWDAIVSHWLVPCALVGQAVARGRRHVAIAHGSDVALLRRWPGGGALARGLARRADLIYVAESLRLPGAPGRIVPMPAERPLARRTPREREQARRALGLSPVGQGPPVALFVGRLVDDKGLDLLLAALPRGMPLLVVGSGPAEPALRAQAGPQVRFLGPRFAGGLRSCFAAADVLVVPSRRDGSPTVVAEARAIGVPVLGTAVGGLPEAVGDGGQIVAPCIEALSDALRRGTWVDPPVIATRSWDQVGPAVWNQPVREKQQKNSNIEVITY